VATAVVTTVVVNGTNRSTTAGHRKLNGDLSGTELSLGEINFVDPAD